MFATAINCLELLGWLGLESFYSLGVKGDLGSRGCCCGGRSNAIYFHWGIDLEFKACSVE